MFRVVSACALGAVVLAGVGSAEAGSLKDSSPTNWSGLYVGAHAGYAWGDASTTDDIKDWCAPSDTACIKKYVGPFDFDLDGAFGGGTIGFNFQHRGIVFGPEAEIGYLDLTGSRRTDSSNPNRYQTLEVDGGFYAVLGGRVGAAFGNTLIYGKGGWVWWDTDATQTTTTPGFTTHGTGGYSGWAYGGGIEHALSGGWSIKAEYLHFDLDTEGGDQTRNDDGYTFNNWTDIDADTVKVGLNYKFGGREERVPLK